MEFEAQYYDGVVARAQNVLVEIEQLDKKYTDPKSPEFLVENSAAIAISKLDSERGGRGHEIAHWRSNHVFSISSSKTELRLGVSNRLAGERLVFSGSQIDKIHRLLPGLAVKRRKNIGRQMRFIGLASGALVSLVGAYIIGIPLMANRIVGLVPAQTEVDFGLTIAGQMPDAFAEQGGIPLCDEDANSVANLAIARFVDQALQGVDTPFAVDIQVVNNPIPNAFALPGGQAYYFSGLLQKTQNSDEFSAVLAHEIGHVVARHGMQKMISSAGTGLLVGFVLGDITGLSVAGGLGSVLINNSFSREAEREADAFAAQVSTRMNFNPAAMVNLLDRVALDDEFAKAMALFGTHPLNSERREALAQSDRQLSTNDAQFSSQEWLAIKSMCSGSGTANQRQSDNDVGGDEGSTNNPTENPRRKNTKIKT
ncbi:MAG: M48 family metallopeptidase [Devosiaceae bacterium]|nr:M48 family metallopeptidase [Devosiaceae bacterium]